MENKEIQLPDYVADWVEYCKKFGCSLVYALTKSKNDEVIAYLYSKVNQETFAKAWVYGYKREDKNDETSKT